MGEGDPKKKKKKLDGGNAISRNSGEGFANYFRRESTVRPSDEKKEKKNGLWRGFFVNFDVGIKRCVLRRFTERTLLFLWGRKWNDQSALYRAFYYFFNVLGF